MSKCDDYWCEHYDKEKGNCDSCVKNELAKDKTLLNVLMTRRAVKQSGAEKKKKGSSRKR